MLLGSEVWESSALEHGTVVLVQLWEGPPDANRSTEKHMVRKQKSYEGLATEFYKTSSGIRHKCSVLGVGERGHEIPECEERGNGSQ